MNPFTISIYLCFTADDGVYYSLTPIWGFAYARLVRAWLIYYHLSIYVEKSSLGLLATLVVGEST